MVRDEIDASDGWDRELQSNAPGIAPAPNAFASGMRASTKSRRKTVKIENFCLMLEDALKYGWLLRIRDG